MEGDKGRFCMKDRVLGLFVILISFGALSSDFKIGGNSANEFSIGDIVMGEPLPARYLSEHPTISYAFTHRNNECMKEFRDRLTDEQEAIAEPISNALDKKKSQHNNYQPVDNTIEYKEYNYRKLRVTPRDNIMNLEVYYDVDTLIVLGIHSSVNYVAKARDLLPLIREKFGEPKLYVEKNQLSGKPKILVYSSNGEVTKAYIEKNRNLRLWTYPMNIEDTPANEVFYIILGGMQSQKAFIEYVVFSEVLHVGDSYTTNMEICSQAIKAKIGVGELSSLTL